MLSNEIHAKYGPFRVRGIRRILSLSSVIGKKRLIFIKYIVFRQLKTYFEDTKNIFKCGKYI